MRVFIASTISEADVPCGVLMFEYSVLNIKFLPFSFDVVSQISTTDESDFETQHIISNLSLVITTSLSEVIVKISFTVITNDILQN